MAKTTSQIIAENQAKRAEAAAIAASRDAIHQQQMAALGTTPAQRTENVLQNAAINTLDSARKTDAQRALKAVESYVEQAITKKNPKTAREEQFALKNAPETAKQKKDRTQKQVEDYQKNTEIDWTDAAAREQYDKELQRLKLEAAQAEREYSTAEDNKVIQEDLEAITGLSNEERKELEQYAVNQIRDQNLPVEMVGVMPTAQQEASGLINKYGKQRVDELAETFMRQENEDMARKVDEKSRELATKHGIIGSAATIPVAALSGLVGTVGQLQGMARNTGRYQSLDPYATGTIGDTFTGAVRGQVQQNIEQGLGGGFLGKAASVGYQGIMSAADSIARAFLGGGAVGGAALAATGSFSQTMAEASRQGASPAQAALLATVNSGIEALSEKIPLDNLIRTAKGTGAKTVLWNALRQMGIEATTEEISLLGTVLAEAAILQEKSSYKQDIIAGITSGLSADDAIVEANKKILGEALNTLLVSAASGGMSSLSASYADARGMFAQKQEQNNPELNRPTDAKQAGQTAIENNKARRERMAAEEAQQATQEPKQAEAQPNQEPVPAQQSAPTVDTPKQSPEGGQIKGTGAADRNFSGVAAYEDMLSDDNVQRQRPGAVRDVEMPKQDSDGRKVTEFASNVTSASVTPDAMADVVKSLVGDKELSFDTRTNEQSLENAAQTIRENGAETVMADIHAHAESKTIKDGDIENGLVLYAKYANDPDTDSQKAASQIIVDMAALANMSGRNLQLFSLLKRMTPEGQLMAVNKVIESNTKKMQKAGMVKKDFSPVANEQLQQNYLQAAKDAKNAKSEKARQEAEQSMQELQNAMSLDAAAQMPSTFKAKWDAWRYMAMLGNAKTQIRNIGGNLAFVPYKVVKDKVAALGEKLFVVPKNQRTKSLTTDYELMKWARQDSESEAVNDALKYSAKLGDDVSAQKLKEGVQIFGNKKLDDVRKFIESVPGKGDMFFKSRYYASSLAGFLKARGYKTADIQNGNVSDAVLNEARAYAINEAMKATFNDCNVVSDFFATELRYKGDNPVGKLFNIVGEGVMPFRRTPANIAVRFEEYSPMGLVNTAWKAANMVKDGKYTAASVVDSLASSLTGSAAMALGFFLAKGIAGVKITGSGTDEDEKRQGHQDYALEFSVDGQEYSYKIDWAAPANLPLFVGANICEYIENAGGDADVSKFTSFLRGLGNAFEPMLALSCLSGINDLFESARYAEDGTALYTAASKIATGYFTQGIPALARQTTQAFTENKQTTFTTSDDPTIRDIQSAVSGLGVGNPYKTDKVNAWGEKESQGSILERTINAFFNPGTVKKIDNSEVEQEISRLNKSGHDVTPNTAARTISYIDKDGDGHDEVRLTEEQYQKLAETQGQTARKLVEDMIQSKAYQALTDEQKAEAIDAAYLYARKTGEIAAIGESHTGYDQSWMYDVNKGGGANELMRRVFNSSINTSMSDLDNAWDKGYNEETFSRDMEEAYDSYQKAPAAMKRQVYEEASGTAKRYMEARDKGLTHKEVISAIENVVKVHGTGAVNKETGKLTVRDIDRRKAIASTPGLSESAKDILMKAYMADYDPSDESPETTEFKYDYARKEMGLSATEYADTYKAYLDSSKKRDKIAAIRALGYDYGTALALYNLYNGRKKNDLIKLYG